MNYKFIQSAFKNNKASNVKKVLEWLSILKGEISVNIEEKSLSTLNQWVVDRDKGAITHNTGKFFEIQGISIHTNYGNRFQWQQPIINQPEIGILGIITKEINGVLHFLLQAKIEPGNINIVQLSPTLQATKSNYTRVHKGNSPLFLEYFNGNKKVDTLIDQLQSEQGARFLRKRNRNIIIEISSSEDITIPENFIWLTLGQIKALSQFDNVINMDTRTVISSISFDDNYILEPIKDDKVEELILNDYFESMFLSNQPINSIEAVLSWITSRKTEYDLSIEKHTVFELADWIFDGNIIYHKENKYFTVIGVDVNIENREVFKWSQPMIKPAQEGLIGFIVKKVNGTYHFLIQTKVEAGNLDILELAPTVQCLTGNYRDGQNEYSIPFINDILFPQGKELIHKSLQSEEGGRFYKEQNLNIIVEKGADFCVSPPQNYYWVTLKQLMMLMKFNNYLNIATRNLISLIPIQKDELKN